jgi:hypothetical protein
MIANTMQIIKKNLLWIMLLLTLAACFYVAQQDNGINQADDVIVLSRLESKHINRDETSKNPNQEMQASSQLLRAKLTDNPKNIFTAFVSDAELQRQNIEKLVEAPPNNPFVFAGKLVDDGKIIVFLMDAQKNYSVVTGDILEDVWQVKSIVPPMMTIRYLPLKIDMQLQIGALS